jgi:hypothetical protein
MRRKIPSASGLLLLGLALAAVASPASGGCMCRNYSGTPFCAESLLTCQAQAGNCMESCEWRKADVKKKSQKKENPKNKSMLVF